MSLATMLVLYNHFHFDLIKLSSTWDRKPPVVKKIFEWRDKLEQETKYHQSSLSLLQKVQKLNFSSVAKYTKSIHYTVSMQLSLYLELPSGCFWNM